MPPEGVFHLQHWYALEAEAEAALYEGKVAQVIDDLRPRFEVLSRSLLLHLQTVRSQSRWLWGRLMLALATHNEQDAGAQRQAARAARKCAREGIGYATVWAHLMRAGLANLRGDTEAASSHLDDAIADADANLMRLCAAAARLRKGELVGGAQGEELVAEARAWMTGEGIVEPGRMADVVLPGF
jgi:hypothetical protein